MAFKVNIAHKGKTYKVETENESIIGKAIGQNLHGEDISADLKGYELHITGTSDLSGIPGFKGLKGTEYHRKVLTLGPGMKDRSKGLRLRKTMRGEEISIKTHQINTTVAKEGEKKFLELLQPKESSETSEKPSETPKKPAETPKPEDKK
jgi:small subunit ribosomal protein S6e